MMSKKWPGILEIDEINHIRDGKIIWTRKNIKNLLHTQGEEFFLNILFTTLEKPEYYHFGLDNRSVISVSDTLEDLVEEPTTHGYNRQTLSSSSSWTFSIAGGNRQVKSPIITFSAFGGSWGPSQNLFMASQAQSESAAAGYLISSVALGTSITLVGGESVSLRMSIKLKDCS